MKSRIKRTRRGIYKPQVRYRFTWWLTLDQWGGLGGDGCDTMQGAERALERFVNRPPGRVWPVDIVDREAAP